LWPARLTIDGYAMQLLATEREKKVYLVSVR
jgi:hypothetical protein